MTEQTCCDICGSAAETQWVWATPNTVETVEEALAQQVFWAEDPEWFVCDTCHRMILNDRRDQLLMRALMMIGDRVYLSFGSEEAQADLFNMREYARAIHAGFWANKTTFRPVEDSDARPTGLLPVRQED